MTTNPAAERLMDWLTETCPCDHDTPCDCKRRCEAMVRALEEAAKCGYDEFHDVADAASIRALIAELKEE